MMHHFWPFLAVALLLVILVQVAMLLLRSRKPAVAARAEPVAALPDHALRDEVQDLRDRVRVLERIVTDERGPRRLASEIDRLREE